jgi:hypothetical protein
MPYLDSSVEYKWEKETSDWMEGKTFGIPEPHNCVPPPLKNEWHIEKITDKLVEKKLIHASIQSDATLYSLLITQMELQLLRNLVVPKGVGMGNFYRNVETSGLRIGTVREAKAKFKKLLETETGINIDHWYKIEMVEGKRKRVTEVDRIVKKVSFYLHILIKYICSK